jgi:DNA-binding YbaB/EbfC family protein
MANFGKLMKQAQEMQARMAKMQDELAAMEFEASSGGGMVTVKMNGQQEVLGVSIDEEVFNDGDREMLEDLIVAAINEARQKAGEAAKEHMAKITGGMNLPGLPGLF